jgi:small subunit ribosomal protein S8
MNSDPISDMLTRIRNGGRANLPVVEMPHSKIKEGIANILKKEGYVSDVSVDGSAIKTMKISLKYEGRKPVIEGLRRISSPGLRSYTGASDLPRVRGGLGVAIMSTSQGVMSGRQARSARIGGEVLCYVW